MRDRTATEQRLVTAVGTILASKGFGALGINAVAKEAGVDKVLIYRYFDGLSGLMRAFSESADFWPTEAELFDARALDMSLSTGERLATIVNNWLAAVKRRPLSIEIMAWETVENTETTRMLSEFREQRFNAMLTLLPSEEGCDALITLGALLAAGLHYLLIRQRHTRLYAGIDLWDESGWARLQQAVELACGVAPAARN